MPGSVPSLMEILAANADALDEAEARAELEAAVAAARPPGPVDLLEGVPRVDRSARRAGSTIPALGGVMDHGAYHGPRGGQGPNTGRMF